MYPIKDISNFHKRNLSTLFLILIFIWSLNSVNWNRDLFHRGGLITIFQIVKAFFHPDLSANILKLAFISTWRTLAYAVAGMSLAISIGLTFGILASGILFSKDMVSFILTSILKRILGFMRSIHELVWAWLFVAAIGLSPLAAIFAIAIPYGGALGRIFSDILNDVPKKPIDALKSSGASRLQILFYGYLPMAITDMISYVMYRFECAIRSSTIMSFVGLGGLGFQIHLSLMDLEYNETWTFIFFLIGLVLLVDIWSNLLRKRLLS